MNMQIIRFVVIWAVLFMIVYSLMGCTIVIYGNLGQDRKISTPTWTYTSAANDHVTSATQQTAQTAVQVYGVTQGAGLLGVAAGQVRGAAQ